MTQEDKELLLQDLSARLPYGVLCDIGLDHPLPLQRLFVDRLDGILLDFYEDGLNYQMYLSEVKPYLLPLSSVGTELKNFIKWKLTTPWHDSFDEDSIEDLLNNNRQVVNFCYEHNLDINGFIENGLAKDATGLNIY